ncbi:MAG: type VI secretion system baseplate subunit TssG, partial [Syntrophorhabdaceae bacterium]
HHRRSLFVAAKDGDAMPGIKEDLLSNSSSFTFIQAVRLLTYYIHTGGDEFEDVPRRKIRVRPNLSLDFPGSDIVSIEPIPEELDKYRLTVTFLGLYGSSSPLPTFYTEDLLEEASDDKSISRDFIDIINNPAYTLFFKCWGKYSFFYNLVESRRDDMIDRLYCLLGFGTEKLRKCFEEPSRFLRYIGLATQMPRSAEGLRSLISDAIREPTVDIEQCVPEMVNIPEDQRFILGLSGNRLGEDTSIGAQVPDSTGKFRIHIGPLTNSSFNNLIPDGKAFRRIGELIDFYLDQPLGWDLEVEIGRDQIRPAGLGDMESGNCRLGWNTWLSSDNDYPENRIRLEAQISTKGDPVHADSRY